MRFYKYKKVFSTKFFDIESTVNLIDNEPYYRIVAPSSVICFLIGLNGDLFLINHYRIALNQMSLELPAGAIENKESPYQAVKREIFEEIGSLDVKYKFFGKYRLMANRYNNYENIFMGVIKSHNVTDNTVIIKRGDLRNMILNNEFKQLAGLGAINVISLKLGVDILSEDINNVIKLFENF
jgi:hypothetical protein